MSIAMFIALLLISFVVFILMGVLAIIAWFLFAKLIDFLEGWL